MTAHGLRAVSATERKAEAQRDCEEHGQRRDEQRHGCPFEKQLHVGETETSLLCTADHTLRVVLRPLCKGGLPLAIDVPAAQNSPQLTSLGDAVERARRLLRDEGSLALLDGEDDPLPLARAEEPTLVAALDDVLRSTEPAWVFGRLVDADGTLMMVPLSVAIVQNGMTIIRRVA